ncbi:hypothetical protein I3U64_00715 [Mycobacteroides abscessus subsp. abscessus]|nr:hypothetical protein [Mycobacteroides abscessus subsp. abscessus]MBN7458666.1 hypothetical protein [Mycobacteroides abscessus subsp. abscessus]MBN7554020.1 hypothetical protein [Mycobacteroides abscessus subsp. abscessus]QSM54235.1 hypothetical protein IN840_04695 [Mycobacteroides abscessus subsp. abscessus]
MDMEDIDNQLQLIDATQSDTGETSLWFAAWGDDSRVDVVYPRIMQDTNDYPLYREAQEFIERQGLVWAATVPCVEPCFPLEPEELTVTGLSGSELGNVIWEVYLHPRFNGRALNQMPRSRPLYDVDGTPVYLASTK